MRASASGANTRTLSRRAAACKCSRTATAVMATHTTPKAATTTTSHRPCRSNVRQAMPCPAGGYSRANVNAYCVALQTLGSFPWTAAFNFTHRINRLSFGQDYPGLVNPLDGRDEYTRERTAIASLERNLIAACPKLPRSCARGRGRRQQTRRCTSTSSRSCPPSTRTSKTT